MTIDELFENMDWPLLRQQKDMLLAITCDDESNPLTGLVTLLDEVYDAAEDKGLLTFNDFLENGEEVNCGLQIDGLDTLRNFRWDGSLSITDAGREKYATLLSLHYKRDEIGDIHLLLPYILPTRSDYGTHAYRLRSGVSAQAVCHGPTVGPVVPAFSC